MRLGVPRRVQDIVHRGTYAAGAISSTAEDLTTWLQALHGGKVLSSRSYAELIEPSKLADGTPTRYALGTSVAEDRHGLKYIGHNGGGFGFSSEVRWYPGAQLAVVVLTNSEPDEITMTAEDLAAAVIPVPPSSGPFVGDVSALAGTYKGAGPGGDRTMQVTQTAEGPGISVPGTPANPLVWVQNWTFRGRGGTLLTFRRTAHGGPATELEVDTAGDHFILRRQ
jgi:hypothetical protein